MSFTAECDALRRHLDELAAMPDQELLPRYAMQQPSRPPGLYWQLRWLAGRILRWLESKGIIRSDPWPVSLKLAGGKHQAKPLLIWAVDADRDSLREACNGISAWLPSLPGFAPVLVTDVADFAFFSRLGWLVEYLPSLSGSGERFENRKMRFIARLYRGAPAVPVSAGLASESAVEEIRRWVEPNG